MKYLEERFGITEKLNDGGEDIFEGLGCAHFSLLLNMICWNFCSAFYTSSA